MASDSSDVILDEPDLADLPDLPVDGADPLLVTGFADAGRQSVWATRTKICPHCGRVIHSKHVKKHHQRFHINLELSTYPDSLVHTDCEYQCLICGMGFNDGVTWKQHVSSDHRSAMRQVAVRDVIDGDVTATSSTSRGRRKSKTPSLRIEKRTGKSQESLVKISRQKVALHIVCEICSATFPTRDGLTNHKLLKHPEPTGSDSKTRVCDVCSTKVNCDFPGAFEMHRHLTHGVKDSVKAMMSVEGKAKVAQKPRGSSTGLEIGRSAEIVVVANDLGMLSPPSALCPTSPPASSSSPVPALGVNVFTEPANNDGLKLVSSFSLAHNNTLPIRHPAYRQKCNVCQGTHTNRLQCHLCPHCNMKFTSNTIDAHQYKCLRISSTIHNGNSRTCVVCFESLEGKNERSILNHMLFHTAHSYTFVCTFCLQTCSSNEVLTSHIQQHKSSKVIVDDLVDMYEGTSVDVDHKNFVVAPAFRNSGNRSVPSTSARGEGSLPRRNEPDESMATSQEGPHDISESMSTDQVSIPTSSLKEEPTVDISSDEEDVDEFIECIYCGFTSDSGNAIRSHFFQTHPDQNFPRLDKHVKTQETRLANARIKKEKVAKKSRRSMPGTSGISNRSLSESDEHSSSDESEELVECLFCDYTSDNANLIRAHFFQCHPEQNYPRLEKYITMHEKRIRKLKQQKTQLEVVRKKMEEQQKLFNERLEAQNALVRQRLDAFDRQMQPLIQSSQRSQSPPRPSSRSPVRSYAESVNRNRPSSPMVQISVTEYNSLAGRLVMDGPSTSLDRSSTSRPVEQPRPLIKLEPLADVSDSEENEGPAYPEPESDSDVPDKIDPSSDPPDLDFFPVQDVHQVTAFDSPSQDGQFVPEKRKPGRPKSVNSNRSAESRPTVVSPSRQASYSRRGRGRGRPSKKFSQRGPDEGVAASPEPVSNVAGNSAQRGRRGRPRSRPSNISRGGLVVTPCSVVLKKCSETLLRSPAHTLSKDVSVSSLGSEHEDIPTAQETEPIIKKGRRVSKAAVGTTISSSTKPLFSEPSKHPEASIAVTSADVPRLLSDEDDPIDDYLDVVGLYDSDDAEPGSPEKRTQADEVADSPVKGAARKASKTSSTDSPSFKKKSEQRSPSPQPQRPRKGGKVTLRQCSIRLDDISKKSTDSTNKSDTYPVSVPYSATLFSSTSADVFDEVSDGKASSGEAGGKRPGRPRGRKRRYPEHESPENDDSDNFTPKLTTQPTKRRKVDDIMYDTKKKKEDEIEVLYVPEEEVMEVPEAEVINVAQEEKESDMEGEEVESMDGESEADDDSVDSDDGGEEFVFGPDNERLPSLLKIPPIPKLPRTDGRVCPVCEKTFSKAMYTNGHILSNHAKEYLGKTSELKCPGCDSVLSGPQGLHAHLHFVHKKDAKIDIHARLLWKAKLEELSAGSSGLLKKGTKATVSDGSSVETKKFDENGEKKKVPVEKTEKKRLPVEKATSGDKREKRKSTSGIVQQESERQLVKDVRIVADKLEVLPAEDAEAPQKRKRRSEQRDETVEVNLVSDNDSNHDEEAMPDSESSGQKVGGSHCPLCSKIFDPTRVRNQEDHIVGHHAEELTGKPFRMKCSQCSYVSHKPSTFYKHIKNAHGTECKAMNVFNNTRNSPVFLNILRLANDHGKKTECDVISKDADESNSSTKKRKKNIPAKEKIGEPSPEEVIVEAVSDDDVVVEELLPETDSGSSYIADEDRATTPDQPWANSETNTCPVCCKRISSVQLKREDHIISFHSKELTNKQLTVVCWECDDDFLRPINLYKHILMKHGPESGCMKKFRKLRRSRRYVKVLEAAYRERSEDCASEGGRRAEPDRKSKKKGNSDSTLDAVKTKTLDLVLKRSDSKCPICGTEHSGRNPSLQMADHIVQNHSKELTGKAYDYKCNVCSHTCTQFSSIYMHCRKKHPDQPVVKRIEIRTDAEFVSVVKLAFEKGWQVEKTNSENKSHVENTKEASEDESQKTKEASEKISRLRKTKKVSAGASLAEETNEDSPKKTKERVECGAWGFLSEAASSVGGGDGDKKLDRHDTEANPVPLTHSEATENPSTSSVSARNDRTRHCLICGKGFPSPALTTDHIVDDHSLQLVNKQHTITCTVCGHVSSRCKSALQHIRAQHPDKPDAVKEFSQIRKSKRYLDIIRTCKGLKYPVQNVAGDGANPVAVDAEVELLDCFVLMTDCMQGNGGKALVLPTIKEEAASRSGSPVSRSGTPVSRPGTPIEELRKSVSRSSSPISHSGTPVEPPKKSKRGRKPKQSKKAEKETQNNVSSISEDSAMGSGKVLSADTSRDSPDLEVSLKDSINQCLLSLDDTSAHDDVTTQAPVGAAEQAGQEPGNSELATEETNVTIRAESMADQVRDTRSDESIISEPGDVILAIREDAVNRDDVTMAIDDDEAKEVSTADGAVTVDTELENMDTSEVVESTEATEDAKESEEATEDPEKDPRDHEDGTEVMKEAGRQTELSEDGADDSQQTSDVPEDEDNVKDPIPITTLAVDDATEVAECRMEDTAEVAEDDPEHTTDLHEEAMESAPESAEEAPESAEEAPESAEEAPENAEKMTEPSADEVGALEDESDTKAIETGEPLDGQLENAETETEGASCEDPMETSETTGITAVDTEMPEETTEDIAETIEETAETSEETAEISEDTMEIPEETAEISEETTEMPEVPAEISKETAEISEEAAAIPEETGETDNDEVENDDTVEKNEDIETDEAVMDKAEDADMTVESENIQPDTGTHEPLAGMEMAIAEANKES